MQTLHFSWDRHWASVHKLAHSLRKEGLRLGQVDGGAVCTEANPCTADRELEKAPTA